MIYTYKMVLCLAVAEHKQQICHHCISILSIAWYWSDINQQPMHENIESETRNNQE